jgi:hypothetical protein
MSTGKKIQNPAGISGSRKFAALAAGLLLLFPWIAKVDAFGLDNRDYWPWQSASLGGGGYMQGVVFSGTPGILHTYSDVGGAWRSVDGGASWRIISGGLPVGDGFRNVRGLHADSSNASRLLVAVGNQWTTNRGVFASTDGGASWIKRLDARFLGNEAHRSTGNIFATTGGAVFVGTAGSGLWRSTDGGTNWTLVGLEGMNITDVKALSGGGLAVCAAAYTLPSGTVLQGGFFRFAANLEDLESSPQGPEEVVEGDGKLVGIFSSARIRSSTDGGASWQDFSEGLPIDEVAAAASFTSESRFRALAVGSGFHLMVSSRGTVYRRNFGASTWTAVARQSVQETFEGQPWWGRMQPGKWQHFGAAAGSLSIDPANPSRWWMMDWYGLYESTDAGANWTLRIDGVESTVAHCIEGSPGGSRVLAGIADNGPLVSDDGGARFDAGLPFSNLRALGISTGGRVYGAGSAAGEWQANTVWTSTDSGTGWAKAAGAGLPEATSRYMNSLAVSRSASNILHVAVGGSLSADGGVYRSNDSGASFEALRSGMESAGEFFQTSIWTTGSELAINSNGTLVCASRSRNRAFRLTSGCSTWTPAMVGLPGQQLDLRAGNQAFHAARGTAGVWTSLDEGGSWSQILATYTTVLAADPGNDLRLAAVVPGLILWTDDGGANWHPLPRPPHREIRAMAFHGDRLVVGTNGGGLFFTDTLVPSIGAQSLTRSQSGSTKFHASQLPGLAAAGANATVRFLDTASLSGGTVSRSGSWITYRPPDGLQNWQLDSFPYMTSGGAGTFAGTISLGVAATEYSAAGTLLTLADNPAGPGKLVVFAGIPGVAYQVRASSNLSTWSVIQSATADILGCVEITDTGATGTSRFYSLSRQ